MKFMRKLFKKNNKGLSLVELICAIAILGLSTTAIGGAMVMSAQHYQKDAAEFEIQEEAQMVTNQVGNLIVDAAHASWDDTNKKLTVVSDSGKHVIYQDGEELKYEQYNGADVLVAEGILAEGIADNGFVVDDSAFDSNKNVSVSLTMSKANRNINAVYNATCRNGEVSESDINNNSVVISTESDIVIEPLMKNDDAYKTLVAVNGMEWDAVGGVVLDTSYGGTVPNWLSLDIETVGENHFLVVEAEAHASGSYQFLLKTVNKKADGVTPLAEKLITVDVRRVNDVTLAGADGTVGGITTAGNVNTVFVLNAEAHGTNLTKGFGKKYDDAPYDYINPRYIEFRVLEAPADLDITVVKNEDADLPSFSLKLNENMMDGQIIKVGAYSKHAYNGVNKSGEAYDQTNQVVEIYTIECDRPSIPLIPQPTFDECEFMRGKDYNWGKTVPINDFIDDVLIPKYGSGISFNWYVRFAEKGTDNWTPYHITAELGDNEKIEGKGESMYMLPDKAYDIQFFVLYTKGDDIIFPNDATLLEAGKGFEEAGFSQGWTNGDEIATTFSEYGDQTTLDATELYYYNNPESWANDDFNNITAGEQWSTVGNDGDGAVDFSLNTSRSDNNGRKVYFDTRYLYRTEYDSMTPVIWKKAGTNWEQLTVDTSEKKVYYNGKQCFTYQMDKNDGNFTFYNVYDQNEAEDVTTNKKGIYRMGFEISGSYYTYTSNSVSVRTMDGTSKDTWKLYDESSDSGFYYFEIKN